MAYNNQSRFTAKINDVDVYSIRSRIDYELDNIDDRLECINEVLEYGDEFYQTYFDEYCNVELSASDVLLSETNVVQSLESMANYILAKDEEYDKAETKYFVNEAALLRKSNKEDEFVGGKVNHIKALEEDVEDDQPKNNSNFKKEKKQRITNADLNRDDYLGEVLRDYDTFLTTISKYTEKNNNEDGENVKHLPGKKANRYMYTKHKGAIKDDMIIVKDSLLKVHGYNLKNFSESTQPDYSVIDLSNVNHLLGGWIEYESSRYKVKSNGLLSFKSTNDYQDDFNCVVLDMENLINKCDLSEFEIEVLELYREGFSPSMIANELDSYKVKIGRVIEAIAKKISNMALHYN